MADAGWRSRALARAAGGGAGAPLRAGAGKGALAVGADADMVLLDRARRRVEREDLLDRHRLSPFVGRTLRGRVVRTLLRGATIARDGRRRRAPRPRAAPRRDGGGVNVASLHASVALAWLADGRRVAEGLLVATDGSSPLAPGASMLVDGDGAIEGSVSGGCVESAVAQEAMALLAGAGGARLRRYGILPPSFAGTAGLTCGGTVEILVHAVAGPDADATAAALRARVDGRPAALATVVDGPLAGARLALVDGAVVGSLTGRSCRSPRDAGAPRGIAAAGAPAEPGGAPVGPAAVALLQHSLARDLHGMLAQGRGGIRHYGADGATMGREVRVFVAVDAPPPRLAIVGATDFSAALAPLARALGWTVSICDARAAFARADRFARAADVVVAAPGPWVADQRLGPGDALLVFSHDPKHDEPALVAALAGEAGFIGALGSRRTAADRALRLRAAGASNQQLRRLHSPCGLDIGARTPEEQRSVLAEIIAFRAGRPGTPLRRTAAPIPPALRPQRPGPSGPGLQPRQVLRRVDVVRPPEAVAGHEPDAGGGVAQQLAGAGVAAQGGHAPEGRGLQHGRVTRHAVVGGAHGVGPAGIAGGHHARDRRAVEQRLVAEHDHDGRRAARGRGLDTGAQGGAEALAPRRAHHHRAAAPLDVRRHRVGPGAEDDDDVLHPAGGQCRQRPRQQRPSAKRHGRLGHRSAEACRRPPARRRPRRSPVPHVASHAATSFASVPLSARRSRSVSGSSSRASLSRWSSTARSTTASPWSVSDTRTPRRSSGSGERATRPAASSLSSRLVMPPVDMSQAAGKRAGRGGAARRRGVVWPGRRTSPPPAHGR